MLCLDNSGSMSGAPFNALKEGLLEYGESIYKGSYFQDVVTLFFNSTLKVQPCGSYKQLSQFISPVKADGGTNFGIVFAHITDYLKKNPHINDLSVIFFTDGCASYPKLEFDAMKIQVKKIKSKFFTIGFTANHDAGFLNQIA